jgi:hypothetical protein
MSCLFSFGSFEDAKSFLKNSNSAPMKNMGSSFKDPGTVSKRK